jgi:Niemann-Pick C2 protein
VNALIGNLPFPFIGVDGVSACNNVFDESGNKASCPLQKGQTYIYRNSFKVLEIYPKIQLVVHWALRSGNQDIICFEVPARII